MKAARRFDSGRLDSPQRTPQGGLRVPAYLTRTGVFLYTREDGSLVREYRPPEEVFKADSLATLPNAPVTLRHPAKTVTPANFRDVSIGHVGDTVKQDADKVAAVVFVQDADAIDAIERRGMREVSCGYECHLDESPGTSPEGERYDRIQRDIVYNHVAVVERGRAGSDVSLRLDAADNAVSPFNREDQMKIEIINGVEYEVGSAPHKDAVTRRDEAVKQAKADHEALQARHDVATGRIEELEGKLAESSDPKRFDAAVQSRFGLVQSARAILGEEFKFDSLSERAIKAAVLSQARPELKLDGKSDDYVAAAFEVTVISAREDAVEAAHHNLRAAAEGTDVNGAPVTRDDEEGVDASFDRMVKSGRDAWKKPIPGAYGRE